MKVRTMNAQRPFMLLMGIPLLACSDDIVAPSEAAEQVVVEAFLFAGQVVDDVRLTQTVPLGEDPALAPTVDDAVVRLIRGGEQWTLGRLEEPGTYGYLGDDLQIREGDAFRLEVDAFGRTATAETIVPGGPVGVELDKDEVEVPVFGFGQGQGPGGGGLGGLQELQVTVTWENPSTRLHFVDVEGLDPDAESIFPDFIRDRVGGFRFRSAPTDEAFFTIGLQLLEDIGPHRVIVYRVNQEYADLYENRVQDSRDLNEPPSNVTNGLGVFTAFSSQDRDFAVTRAAS